MAKQKYTKGKDGYFKTKVWDGTYNPDGTKHRKNLRTDKSSRALEKMVAEFEAEVSQRLAVKKTDTTFLEYARLWFGVYKKNRGKNTIAMYNNIIEKHLITIGTVKLQNIERLHIQLALNQAEGKLRTQQQILLTAKQIMRSAVADKLFPANVFADIFDSIDPVKYNAPENRPLTDYEKEAVFSAVYKYEQDKAYTYLIYGCGLRREEALALTIFDFDFRKNEVSINKAYEYTDGYPSLKEPKTKNGYRQIPIPAKVLPEIKHYVQSAKASGRTNIFVMKTGKPVTKSSYDKMWARILVSLQNVSEEEIQGLTGHVFRHNYCTNLCYQVPTVSIKKIAQLMGDTEAMVMKVYNHIILEKEDAEKAVENAMNF